MRLRRAIANFKASLRSNAAIAIALALLSAGAVLLVHYQGWTLYYGDADAHLMIARRIIDSQNPGLEQIGSGWLPLLHLMMLPFVRVDAWWRSGLAGSIPVAACFVIGGSFFFAAVRRIFDSTAAAATATALFALNPNVLYLQSIPMTEIVFFAALAALLYFTVRFGKTQGWLSAAAAGVAACAAALTRYDGWFLLPFAAAYFAIAARRHRWRVTLVFCALAAVGPLAWFAFNWWMTGDWLDFFRGPYSPSAIQGAASYPGLHDWRLAWLQFRTAVQLCAGPGLVALGLAGVAVGLFQRAFWPLLLLALPPVFYVMSVHSGSIPIFVPTLYPHSYYNARYGTSALPLLALAAAGLVALVPPRMRTASAGVVILAGMSFWLLHLKPSDWPVWQEASVNDAARRERIREAAAYLAPRYVRGTGVVTSFYPLTSVFREMGLPLREALMGDNGLPWMAAVQRPELFLTQQWAIVEGGDRVQSAINRLGRFGVTYKLEKQIIVGNQQVLEIYRR
jgi:Dolichyl-phosphate-mannose-protein mannosyltransferase